MANGSKYHFEISNAYIAVEGYRYRLIKTEVPNPAESGLYIPAHTIDVRLEGKGMRSYLLMVIFKL
jgi:hypothetical protein